jgi:hypothetical protein
VTPQPLFVLAPPNGESARVAAMLGGHPGAFFVPELNLALAEGVGHLLELFRLADASSGLEEGLLRVVSALFCGGQTVNGVKAARRWLERRIDRPSSDLLWEIAERVAPRQLVVPDTSAIWRPDLLRRLDHQFPDARWLHVVRHPRRFSAVTIAAFHDRLFVPPDYKDHSYLCDPAILDPQVAWYRAHLNLEAAVKARGIQGLTRRVRVEALLSSPEHYLTDLGRWLGWETDEASLQGMMTPQRSVFAEHGPPGAVWGADQEFLDNPVFEYKVRPLISLDGPLEWRPDGEGFANEVRQLAQSFGYA